jgi:hypothetical protein
VRRHSERSLPVLLFIRRADSDGCRQTQPMYESPNRTSKRDSSAACPGAPRKTKSAGHYARNDAPPLPLPS